MRYEHALLPTAIVLTLILSATTPVAQNSSLTIIDNIEENSKQTVLAGQIDSLTIRRGNALFNLGPGELTLFDFGSGRIAAMTYKGSGRFKYDPPDKVEEEQLRRFTGRDTLDGTFIKATFFFTTELEQMPDTNGFARAPVDGSVWDQYRDATNDEFNHMALNITTGIIGDLISSGPGTYFNALFVMDDIGKLAFEENLLNDDVFTLYKLTGRIGFRAADIIGGYTPDSSLPSQRGAVPIDITHYLLDSRIEGDGDMNVRCRINYTPVRWGRQYLYFRWFDQNKIISVRDSKGDTLLTVHRAGKEGVFTSAFSESGFGVVLDEPMVLGQADSLEIVFEARSLENIYGIFYLKSKISWYPWNAIRDIATYDMRFDRPKSYSVIGSGDLMETREANGRCLSRWNSVGPVQFVSFTVGNFNSREFDIPGFAPIRVSTSKEIPHAELALALAAEGELSTADMLGSAGADVANSLTFFTSIMGPCPFDTVRAVELFSIGEGQSAPGLIHLSWDSFQADDLGGRTERFRAHEVAHQWLGHLIASESYRDTWIIEGLSEYCGFWFYQMSSKNTKACDGTLAYWQGNIISGEGPSSAGSAAGPPTMGIRLSSSMSDDYNVIIYQKGAYIFHMIRYLMHDYKTGSDDAFAAFLKDLATLYKGKVITTEKLRALLEKHVDGDMRWFFDQYVYGTGIPEYGVKTSYQMTPEGKYRAYCHITESNVPENFQMMVPLTVFFKDDKYIHLKVWVDKPEMDVDLPLLPYKPEKVIFNTYGAVLCKVKYD